MIQTALFSGVAPLDLGPAQGSLSSALLHREPFGFHSLAAVPSNVHAIEAVRRFAEGREPFVALFGPSGWGKTHLLESAASVMRRDGIACISPQAALQWALGSSRYELQAPVILDDAQDVLRHPRARHQLRQALERRVRMGGRPVLLSFTGGSKPSRAMRNYLPFTRSWSVQVIGEPSVDERDFIVRQIASVEGLHLSRRVVRLIAKHLHGNGRSVVGALQRLKLAKDDWSDPHDVIPACGVLMPYMIGADGWDIRDQVHDAILRTLGGHGPADGSLVKDVAAHILIDEIGLAESEVAAFIKDEHRGVYSRCVSIRNAMKDPSFAATVEACKFAVLSAFDED